MTAKTAMILAAGRGQRMRPLTDSMPKPLLKVRNKALIEYHIEGLKKAGYQRVVINHAWLGEQIEQSLGSGHRFGLQLIYSAETTALETAGGIIQALPYLCPTKSDDLFAVVNGDVFTDYDFANLPDSLETEKAHLVMVNNPEHNTGGDFHFYHGRLDERKGSQLTFSGIAVYQKTFFTGLDLGIRPLAPMLRKAITKGLISAQHFTGPWTDVGTPQRLEKLNT